jgi:hypothetical protein
VLALQVAPVVFIVGMKCRSLALSLHKGTAAPDPGQDDGYKSLPAFKGLEAERALNFVVIPLA